MLNFWSCGGCGSDVYLVKMKGCIYGFGTYLDRGNGAFGVYH